MTGKIFSTSGELTDQRASTTRNCAQFRTAVARIAPLVNWITGTIIAGFIENAIPIFASLALLAVRENGYALASENAMRAVGATFMLRLTK